jgi:hypothetical protein
MSPQADFLQTLAIPFVKLLVRVSMIAFRVNNGTAAHSIFPDSMTSAIDPEFDPLVYQCPRIIMHEDRPITSGAIVLDILLLSPEFIDPGEEARPSPKEDETANAGTSRAFEATRLIGRITDRRAIVTHFHEATPYSS